MSSCPVCGSPVQPNDAVCRTCGAALTPASEVALPTGTTLLNGQYTISRVLGRGGFGITYDAQDVRLGMRVAIKELFIDGSTRRGKSVIPPGSLSTKEYQDTKNRFLDEAKVLAKFDDPGIVRVLNYFEENSTAYLVMEFLEGATLGSAIEKRGPVPPEVVLEIARSLTHTLELIHGAGLLHRDIKPDNIFLHKTGRIVLIDFGSVRTFQAGKTVSHTRLVTPGYAPLEQYGNAARYGPYTDIYSLGATLHHALTGQMPPAATDLMLGTPLPPLPASTPPQLRRAVDKMMSLRVEERPQSAQELRALLVGSAPSSSPAPAAAPPRPQPAQPTRVAPPAPSKPAPQPTPAPTPQPAPAPRPQQPAPQQTARQPTPPKPQPVPAPQPRPQPTPVAPKPAPAPMPQPAQQPTQAPVPAPRAPAPAPVQVRTPAPFSRKLWIFLWMGAAIVLAMLQIQNVAPLNQLDLPEPARYAIAGGVGAVVGALLGWLTWIAMPVVLPLVAGAAAYYFLQQSGTTLPTIIAATIMAADIAILFMWLIRRIRF